MSILAMHDIIGGFIGLTLVHIGAALRFVYHRFIIRDNYSYHSLITESPVFDCSKEPYKEQFKKWKQRQTQRNQAYDIELNEDQQQILEMFLKEGRSKKKIIRGMIETGELKLIDVDIYPRNPEYFSNRVLDGIIGLCFLIILVFIICYIQIRRI
ncbi:transcriptional regulator [Prevotella histicola]|uniref:transcriptional regulator n=2 Tax=Prevotella histicola TaxID=470565 RepID=UPI0027E42402|nr:transcriptional regulator [Prevotella histicola]